MIRLLCVLLALAGPVALGACGSDDIQSLRDQANQVKQDAQNAIDKLGSGATADEIRTQLDKVRKELDKSDLPADARKQLEQARDKLQQAADKLKSGG